MSLNQTSLENPKDLNNTRYLRHPAYPDILDSKDLIQDIMGIQDVQARTLLTGVAGRLYYPIAFGPPVTVSPP